MIKYSILDVDGTLTDGGIYYDIHGNEIKKFCTKDGTGIACAKNVGIMIIVITGRECAATTRRLSELGVTHIFQNVKNKTIWVQKWMEDNKIRKDEVCYIGDDINDIGAMKQCGYVGCPKDSAKEVKDISNYVSNLNGGHGAVRDVIENFLKEEGLWESAIENTFDLGI